MPPEITHPTKVPEEFTLLATINDPFKPKRDYLFLKYENLLVIFTGSDWVNRAGEAKYSFQKGVGTQKALILVLSAFRPLFMLCVGMHTHWADCR